MTNKNIINRQGMFLAGALVVSLLLLSSVHASGVVSPYCDSPGNEYSLRLDKGETKVIQFELQNMAGSNDVTFKVSLQSTQDVAEFVESKDTYLVKLGESVPVPVRITIPSGAEIEDKYRVTLITQEIKSTQPGQFSVGSGFENSFDVIVAEKPKTSKVSGNVIGSFTAKETIIFLIVLVVIILLIIIWFRRRKQ